MRLFQFFRIRKLTYFSLFAWFTKLVFGLFTGFSACAMIQPTAGEQAGTRFPSPLIIYSPPEKRTP